MITQQPQQQNTQTPQKFVQSIVSYSFQEKFFKWQEYIRQLKEADSQYLQAALEFFVESYPFNHSFWADLLELMLRRPKGKVNTLKMFQVALAKNPRCITLWRKFLDWLKKELSASDPDYLKAQLKNASSIIGNHFKAGFIYEYYVEIEPDFEECYKMLKKALVSPLQDLDRLKDKFFDLIDSAEFADHVLTIAEFENFMKERFTLDKEENARILREEIKSTIVQLYEPTKKHIEERAVFESKIKADEYIPYADPIENWREYISFIKNSGNAEFLPSIYERALINQCDNESLWEQYFLILQSESNHQRVLFLLRSHSYFFRSLSKELIYYWLEIEERDNPAQARELYLQLQISENELEIFMRHIQMEVRAKEFQNAKTIFDAILTIYTANLEIVARIVVEYADFSVKNFRDIPFAKKLLQNYVKSYPFHEYLLMHLLQFYEKNVEYKEGAKQTKEIAEEYVEYLLLGLKKAYNCSSNDEYSRIKKMANYHFRSYICSIYLIKGAERKIKQQQFALKKENEQVSRAAKHHNCEIEADELSGRKRIPDS